MTFLDTWPIQKFTEEENTIKSIVFNRDQVITLDSNSSKFIYVLKSGSISVLISLNQNKLTDSIGELNESSTKKNEAGYFPHNQILDDHHKEQLLEEGLFIYIYIYIYI